MEDGDGRNSSITQLKIGVKMGFLSGYGSILYCNQLNNSKLNFVFCSIVITC